MARLQEKLYPRLAALVLKAKALHKSITIDAEESPTLIPTLLLVERLFQEKVIQDWDGFGIAVQAYQKRAAFVIDWLIHLANQYHTRIAIRLVKGAYWDVEIKQAQVEGLSGYAVFTRKAATDLNYQYCAQKLLKAGSLIYPEFGTHNAYTVAMIQVLAAQAGCTDYQFQRLPVWERDCTIRW